MGRVLAAVLLAPIVVADFRLQIRSGSRGTGGQVVVEVLLVIRPIVSQWLRASFAARRTSFTAPFGARPVVASIAAASAAPPTATATASFALFRFLAGSRHFRRRRHFVVPQVIGGLSQSLRCVVFVQRRAKIQFILNGGAKLGPSRRRRTTAAFLTAIILATPLLRAAFVAASPTSAPAAAATAAATLAIAVPGTFASAARIRAFAVALRGLFGGQKFVLLLVERQVRIAFHLVIKHGADILVVPCQTEHIHIPRLAGENVIEG
jgi:hypothetical protein